MKKITLIISLIILSGCATTEDKKMDQVIVDNTTKTITVLPDERYMDDNSPDCPEYLPDQTGKLHSDTIAQSDAVDTLYYNCWFDKKQLIDFINKNIKTN